MRYYYRLIVTFFICLSTYYLSAQSNDCLNYTNLSGANVTCRYGYYSNPDAFLGIISGRHTVMKDTSIYDSNTNFKLRVIPLGESTSIRLGNSSVDGEAESITYRISVDTLDFNLLFLKYAVVLENPDHTKEDQPRFKLEIYNASNQLISPECGAADFYAGFGGNWKIEENYTVPVNWKDWTITGFDLTSYQGKTIYVKLTTYDCDRNGHFGYAYFNLQCGKKKIVKLGCNNSDSVTLQAPTGYKYRWYKNSVPNDTLSKNRNLRVLLDGSTYYCECAALHNENCKFTISSKAKNIYPMPKFSYYSNCYNSKYQVHFTNRSYTSDDGIIPNDPSDSCDFYNWQLHDGSIISSKNPEIIYKKPGKYPIKLSAYIGAYCYNTLTDTVIINDEASRSYVNTTICYEDNYNFGGKLHNKTGVYTDTLRLSNGCDSILYLNLTVRPKIETNLQATICYEDTYNFLGRILNKNGIYRDTLNNVLGCDSILILNLTVRPKIETFLDENICYGNSYNIGGNLFNKSGIYTVVLKTKNTNCDSTITLKLNVYDPITFTTNVKHYVSERQKGVIEITNAPTNYTYSINGVRGGALTNLETGTYTIKVFDFRGCPSDEQKVSIIDCPQVNIQIPEICGDDKFFDLSTEIKKGSPVRYSVIFNNLAKQNGFEDLQNKDLTSNTITIAIPNKVVPNKYYADVIFYNNTCESEKYTVLIEISYPSSIIVQKWNDVIALLNKDYNGGYEFTAYQWYKNNELISGENATHIYILPSLEFGASYKLKLTRTDGVELFTCPIVAKPHTDISVYPTSVKSGNRICIKSQSKGKVIIRNTNGVALSNISINNQEEYISMPYKSGLYILEIHTETGEVTNIKVVVNE